MSNRVNALRLYRGSPYPITDKITLYQPEVSDLEDKELLFWVTLYTFIGTTTMHKLQLWDRDPRVDWTKISNYELFCQNIVALPPEVTGIFFGDLDFTTFELYKVNGVELEKVQDIPLKPGQKKPTYSQKRKMRFRNWQRSHTLYSQKLDIELNADAYHLINDVMREMVHIYPKDEYAVGMATKEVLIEEERNKADQRERDAENELSESVLQPMISACVCNANYPYNIEETFHLKINQFYDCAARLQIVESSRALLRSSYIGLIDTKKIPRDSMDFSRPINMTTK